ncbi:MAG: hypothetical protein AAF998_00630 [Bacteroidota bacterium]
MKKTKLLKLWQSLSERERKRLAQFVRSPYHNQHRDVIALCDWLIEAENPAEATKTDAHATIFPGETYTDLRLRHVMSYLVRLIEDMVAYEAFRREEDQYQVQLLREYGRRNLPGAFQSTLKKSRQKSQRQPRLGPDHHHFNYQLLMEEFNRSEDRHPNMQGLFQHLSDEFDAYYVVNKLKQACIIISHRKLFDVQYDLGLLEEVVRHVEASELVHSPVVRLYYACYRLLTGDNHAAHFREVRQLLREQGPSIDLEEMRFVYVMAINYCIKQINTGQLEYLREVFELYRGSLDDKLLFDNGKLPPWTYKNIVSAGIKLGEFDWVQDFNYRYRAEVSKEYARDFYFYNLAKLHFARRDYRAAARILRNLQVKDTFTRLDATVTLLKSWYELGEVKLIDFGLHNFRQLLQRKGILTYHKKNYQNFARLLNRLINLKPLDPRARSDFRKAVEQAEILTERAWIEEKEQELK